MARLYEVARRDGAAPSGTRGAWAQPLQGPLDGPSLQALDQTFRDAGVPGDYGQAIHDVVLGLRPELPDPPAGIEPWTEAQGARALAEERGPAEARRTIAKAQRVGDALKSISPEVRGRLEHAYSGLGSGNLPGIVKTFARYHDLPPAEQRTMVARFFGPRAAERLFGPAPRSGR